MNVFLLGLTTGMFAVVPVGAVGVLILHKGLRHGFLPAAFGALGAATADTLFAAVALWAGAAAIDLLAPHRTVITLVAGCFLTGLGLWGFLRPPIDKAAFESSMLRGSALLASFGQLFLLNCLNPLIIAFFFGAVVTAGAHGILPNTASSLIFLAGIASAVFGWQLGLAWLGAQGTTRLSAAAQRRLSQTGHGIIVGVGIIMLVSAIFSPAP